MSGVVGPLGVARQKFEVELDGLKRELDQDWGWAPQGTRWILPVAAVAAGFVTGEVVKRKLRRLFDRP